MHTTLFLFACSVYHVPDLRYHLVDPGIVFSVSYVYIDYDKSKKIQLKTYDIDAFVWVSGKLKRRELQQSNIFDQRTEHIDLAIFVPMLFVLWSGILDKHFR